MHKLFIIIICFILPIFPVYAQYNEIKGRVHELDEQGNSIPLPFVNVYWSGTTVGTVTDEDGDFIIQRQPVDSNMLVFSYIGYLSDTILIGNESEEIDVILNSSRELEEVTVRKRLGGSYISKLSTIKTEVITEEGLQKLPCCNLSESFENNAAIDAGFSDAITGARHIKLLGLAGIYSQMLFENIPYLRGLESAFGLNYVPGPWMESIQISKGTASVMNGYESTTGQINVEYKKPDESDPLFINLFANSTGRIEGNIVSAIRPGEKWSTMVLAHASTMQNKLDNNKDGFLDIPLNKQINVMNRWNYHLDGKIHTQVGFSVMHESRDGGQMDYIINRSANLQNYYGLGIDTRRYRAYGKIGFLFPAKPYKGLGFTTSATLFDQEAFFGLSDYSGRQFSYYVNFIYQSIFKTTDHKINAGMSMNYDYFQERYNEKVFNRKEIVPGLFTQYTYTIPDKLTTITGLRADYHNLYGLLVTPRMHIRFDPGHHITIRGSAGKGYRSASVIAENIGLLASSRTLVFLEDFKIEEAWNYGINLTRDIHLSNQREITLSVDFYRTDFVNQVIIDMDQDISEIYFYNLNGRSYSNSLQTEISAEPVERFDVTLAFRFNDVKTTYDGDLLEAPLTSRYKGLLTFAYATRFDKWKFDITGQLNGSARLRDTRMNPEEFRKPEYSPVYPVIHAQISKRFRYFELYAGGENLTGFVQKDPIIAADDPYGDYFDASMIWGPLLGRRFYAGIRLTIE